MMNAPAVSIILPVFNRLAFLRAAVSSVFAQTFANWNLIIADDGSEEDTRQYLRLVENRPRITVLWLNHTGNPAAARNAALREATGEYVAFLDSDDLWMPSKLQRQLASLQQRPDLRWGYTGYSRIDATGAVRVFPGTRRWVPHRGEIFDQLVTLDAEVSTPAVLVQRSLLEQVGEFDESLPLFEDYDLWLRLACQSEIDLIDEPLTLLRSHQEHYSGGAARTMHGRIRQLNKAGLLVSDSRRQRLIGNLRAHCNLDLANIQANDDRREALLTLYAGLRESWRYYSWWTRLPKVLAKLSAPHALLALRRAHQRAEIGLKS